MKQKQLFQFQIGAIKRGLERELIQVEQLFQFQIGAIKRQGFADIGTSIGAVSIPNWCD